MTRISANVARVILGLATPLFWVALGSESMAIQNCSGTGFVVTSDYSLTDDWNASGSTTRCFDVRNGADINLNGHKITCLDDCEVAIGASAAAGTRVYSSPSGGSISIRTNSPVACASAWSSPSPSPTIPSC